MLTLPTYVLVTPARNEAKFIELTIKCVLAQTIRPLKWVIVSDGSTDGTEEIVSKYAVEHPWIELVCMPQREERHFAGKVDAFNAGYARLKSLDYQAIGNLDADITFDSEYFALLLTKLAANPHLGVVGTSFREGRFQYDYRFTSIRHVSGPCQLFRRECFEEIGGYIPRQIGGIDLVAVLTARMKGWETRTFLEKTYAHHRQMGTATANAVIVPFKVGQADYVLGSHPLWHCFRCLYQTTRKPVLLAGIFRLAGFFWAMITSAEKQVSRDLMQFRRKEQMERLRTFIAGLPRFSSPEDDGCPAPTDRQKRAVQHPGGLVYVLITPARNEAAFIELTIKSVIKQTVRPAKWVIVSDGSTDSTDDIVRKFASECPWIELVRMPERLERHFAGKVHAFSAGYAKVKNIKYDVIGSMDADISFDEDYFSFLLGKLDEDSSLGLVGTPFTEDSSPTYDYRYMSIEHVSGACQLFRRQCFEEIGGYIPVKSGGVDHIAVITARMQGWKTRTFTDKMCQHHRKIGSAKHGAVMARFRDGILDYTLGGHPVWEVFRTAYQMTRRPYVIGGLALGAGYVIGSTRGVERPVSPRLVKFHRQEQMQRLVKFLTGNRIGGTETLQHPLERA